MDTETRAFIWTTLMFGGLTWGAIVLVSGVARYIFNKLSKRKGRRK